MSTENEYLQEQIEKAEQSLRAIDERKSLYTLRTDVPIDLDRNEQDLRKRLSDLRIRLKEASSGPTETDKAAAHPSTEAPRQKIYVDRDEERKLFRDMTSSQTPIHILLMEAEGGMGKTILLDQFWDMSEGFKRARVDFKQSSYSTGDILREMSNQYGPQGFSMFYEVCCDALRDLGQDVKQAALLWTSMDLKLAKLSSEDRQKYQKLITESFIADLETIGDKDQPIVLLFDTFEKASDSTKAWVTDQLISTIRHYPRLVLVITGRETPRITTDDLSWCLQHKLQPLSEQHSREYIQKMVYVQDQNIVTFITVHAQGHPYTLQQLVATLSKTNLSKNDGAS
jgi:hypothetical protein